MIKIILDTNFLIYSAKQKVDYVREILNLISEKKEIIVLSSVVSELENLAAKSRKLKNRASAELALKILKNYIKNKKIRIQKSDKNADYAIKEISKKEKNVILATADRKLKSEVKGNVRVLSIKKSRHLELV